MVTIVTGDIENIDVAVTIAVTDFAIGTTETYWCSLVLQSSTMQLYKVRI